MVGGETGGCLLPSFLRLLFKDASRREGLPPASLYFLKQSPEGSKVSTRAGGRAQLFVKVREQMSTNPWCAPRSRVPGTQSDQGEAELLGLRQASLMMPFQSPEDSVLA